MTEYVIETYDLTKKFKKEYGVNSINMKVERGKIYGLLGKNGAGKTTTMSMLLSLSNPTSGEIHIFGKDIKKHPKEIYPRIGSILETPGFYENLTGEENLKIFTKLRGVYNKKNIKSALKMVSLDGEKDKIFKKYSLGMKQRLAIAASIVHNPDLLILDEPINGLDPIGIKEMRNLFKKLVDEFGITILISSHILSEIEHIADVIAIMDNGKLIEEINIQELHKKADKYINLETSDIEKSIEILGECGLKENIDFVRNYDNPNAIKLLSNFDNRAEIVKVLVLNKISIFRLELIEESLEDYFTNLLDTHVYVQ